MSAQTTSTTRCGCGVESVVSWLALRDRWFYPGYRKRQRLRDLHERIKDLESWHRIFDEWARQGDYEKAAEMARRGMSYISYTLNNYYLPVVQEMLSQRRILLFGDKDV